MVKHKEIGRRDIFTKILIRKPNPVLENRLALFFMGFHMTFSGK